MDIYGRSFLAKLDPGEIVTPGNRVYLVNPAWMTQDDSEGSDLAISVDTQQIPVTIINNGGALTKDSILIVHSIGDRIMANVRKQTTGLGCGGFLMPNRTINLAWTFMDGRPLAPRTIIVPLVQTTPGGNTWKSAGINKYTPTQTFYNPQESWWFTLSCFGTAWNIVEQYSYQNGSYSIWYSMDRAAVKVASPLDVEWNNAYTGGYVIGQQPSCYVSGDSGEFVDGVVVMETNMKLY